MIISADTLAADAKMPSLAGSALAGSALAPAAIAGGEVRDYFTLLKPRVMSLVILTAAVGMLTTAPATPTVVSLASLLMIAIGAGASGCLNMWWDADIDAVMTRTRTRPIPAGRVSAEEALAFGMFVANVLAAVLLALTIAFYVVVYSMGLKRWTPQNIVIGGAAGALPPIIGQAAVTGTVHLDSIVLFAIIFVWTPPHFWALALVKSAEYGRAGIPMLPNIAGPDATRRHILAYTIALVPLALLPVPMGFGGIAYGIVSAVSGAGMLALAVKVFVRREGAAADKAAMELFGYSILYLLLLFATLLAEQGLGLFRAVPGICA